MSFRAALLFSLALVLVSAQTPGVPQGGGDCADDWGCSLGGLCTQSKCSCDPWFTGPTCALLNLQAPLDDQGGTCGRAFDSYYSWGGRTIANAAGTYDAIISFMCRHANLGEWTTKSSSAHFTAGSAAGPYTWGAEQCDVNGVCTPAIIPWSHNTVVIEDPAANASERFQIWHVGDGVAPPAEWAPCFNASEVARGAAALPATAATAAAAPRVDPGSTAYVATAPSMAGPWARALHNAGVPINFTGAWTSGLAGNPAPLVMPDGTINLYFTAVPCPKDAGALAPNCIAVATSTTGWGGPFQMNAQKEPITYPESEDPSVFRDPRGNFHLLTCVRARRRRTPPPICAPPTLFAPPATTAAT